ncbi:DNA-binding LacI/PurR family transcriptional regulator [Deinobacterium chartae]|uniref:DNA-binding LacI/PurR family transcriptional regulator n=1 Tax=Deinobacterium chartae TaxID=521158 RepID=A0A841I5Q7_9DEIO|nr:LacI family DNA-binding transcriptional regulator [Deinobacterium chartae]MBB6099778.1 DNA-binding LacI/PurR family transcriptional regulator [Deinobacterium chartae]
MSDAASRKRARRPTSLDVARLAGVDRSTVSLVMNGKAEGRVTEAVQRAVREAARQLGYRPDAAARALRLGRSSAVALLVPQAANPFFVPLMLGAAAQARERGYAVLLVDAGEEGQWQETLLETLSRQTVAGFLLWRPPAGLDLEAWRGRAVLMEVEAEGVPSVLLDVAQGGAAAARHLLDLGHRRLGYLASRVRDRTFELRRAAFLAVLRARGLEVTEVAADLEVEAARVAGLRLLQSTLPPTAVFCEDDLLAAGLYKAARDLELEIPRDLSVVGFNDVELSRLLEPELTTVAAAPARLGALALAALLDHLEGREVPARQVLPTALVLRASTAPPRSG